MHPSIRRFTAVSVIAFGTACASHTAPSGYLPTTASVQSDPYGGWIDLSYRGPDGLTRVMGELVAVTGDTVWIKDASGGTVLPTSEVTDGRLIWYDSQAGQVGGLTGLGVLSTISHGVFLLLTAPLWMIVGGTAAAIQSRIPMEEAPPVSWSELSRFARFPQGIPLGVEVSELSRKPGSFPTADGGRR